ncbi:DUF429 domain-containing protein [Nocardioides sp. Bht2]|uniref:DUF429 domain-containing protein n=1 Tax=Nocardioides sp. Bht2 TaxID=3392297 RepID=UPI0039B6DEEE
MTATRPVRALGVDACKKGWVGISSDARGYFGATITELVAAAELDGALAVVGVDMPIGLPINTVRQSDALARGLIGKRASSVFTTPVRAAISAATHAEATAISVSATGKGLSQQAFALSRKILEVDVWAREAAQAVIEVHPELSFATMQGGPLRHAKSTWSGAENRRRLLREAGIVIPDDLGLAGAMAGVDDVLDAAAAAWTAQRYAVGDAVSHPPVPEEFGDGHLAAIWA